MLPPAFQGLLGQSYFARGLEEELGVWLARVLAGLRQHGSLIFVDDLILHPRRGQGQRAFFH